jgi:large subunit ribosomal protein L30
MSMASKAKKLRITLVKSRHGRQPGHRECLRGLGLRGRNSSATVVATPENLGMINKVSYLLRVEDA